VSVILLARPRGCADVLTHRGYLLVATVGAVVLGVKAGAVVLLDGDGDLLHHDHAAGHRGRSAPGTCGNS